ncbi:MAG TPA: nitronate monooxygenase [Mycobacteriales bacterium]|nr:nitronate monooxygenase [Mycobacteriales bacterium]
MLRTWLTDRFDLTVPVVSAPMAGVSGGALAAAVSTAGALGMIGIGYETAAVVRTEADVARASGRPFGIGLIAWYADENPELVEAAIEAAPALLSLSFGPYADHVAAAQQKGIVVATQAGTVDEALRAVDAGVDLVIARGGEGGGHGRGEVATLPLLEAVLDAVDVPVLAAGGIAGARSLAAVLAAGAAGALVGTAFLACVEGQNSAAARAAVVDAGETDTIYTTVLDIGRGIPWPSEFGGRAVRNAFADRWHGREAELLAEGTRSEEPVVWAGQAVGLVRAERPAADVVADFEGAEALLRRFDTQP